nr:extracellular solute-binding protein [Actinomycetota bacterium]
MDRRTGMGVVARRGAVLAAFMVVSLTLAACGGDEKTPEVPVNSDSMITYESHEALVKAAEDEGGTLKIYTSTQPESIEVILASFQDKYPNVDVEITEQSGSDTPRILLEVQGEATDYDVLYLSQEVYGSYLPYLEQVDMLSMVKSGVLDMPEEMINPKVPYTMAAGSGMAGFSYNPKLLDPSLVPESWEDFLDPALKGKKFLVDIEPVNLATMIPAWGEDKVYEFAEKIGEQEPVWARGETNAITLMGAGEYELHFASNYHSAYRASLESPETIEVALLEPIPVRLTQVQGIRKGADNVAGATLFLEHMASQEMQDVLDEMEPQQSSIYAEGSDLAKLIEGKELSLWTWDYFPVMPAYLEEILETWGFPSAE